MSVVSCWIGIRCKPNAAARSSYLESLGSGETTGQSRREFRSSGTVFFAVSPVLASASVYIFDEGLVFGV